MHKVLSAEARREKILALIGMPVRQPLNTKRIGAELLREIVLETQRRLMDAASYCFSDLCVDAAGKGVSVWSAKAVRFSELGHVYRATRTVLRASDLPRLRDMKLENVTNYVAELIDAQVRHLEGEMTLVTFSMTHGREGLVNLFGRIAERLAAGDSALIAPPVYKEEQKPREKLDTDVFFTHPDILPESDPPVRKLKKPRRRGGPLNRRQGLIPRSD